MCRQDSATRMEGKSPTDGVAWLRPPVVNNLRPEPGCIMKEGVSRAKQQGGKLAMDYHESYAAVDCVAVDGEIDDENCVGVDLAEVDLAAAREERERRIGASRRGKRTDVLFLRLIFTCLLDCICVRPWI